jgi:hypothetical protein
MAQRCAGVLAGNQPFSVKRAKDGNGSPALCALCGDVCVLDGGYCIAKNGDDELITHSYARFFKSVESAVAVFAPKAAAHFIGVSSA